MFEIGIYSKYTQQILELDEIVKSFFVSQELRCRVIKYKTSQAVLQRSDMLDILLIDMDSIENNVMEMARRIHIQDMKICMLCFSKQKMQLEKLLGSAHPFVFLSKPIDGNLLAQQLKDALLYIGRRTNGKELSYKTDDGKVDLDSDEIYYFEFIGGHKTEIKTKHRIYVTHVTLTETLEALRDIGFESPHKGYIINMAHIKRIVNHDIYMENGDKIFISQRKLCDFKRVYNDFCQRIAG